MSALADRRRLLQGLGALGSLAGLNVAAAEHPGRPQPPPDAPPETARAFSFGFIGDTPYNWLDEAALLRVMDAMANEPLAFVLHVGDLKSSGEACSDTLMSARIEMLDRSAHPLILTPGDNDWTDCQRGRPASESDRALERLDWLRRQVFAGPHSLGRRRMAVEQQFADDPAAFRQIAPRRIDLGRIDPAAADSSPRLPENLRWRIGGLQFCTLHVVGSNNGASRQPALARAWSIRQEANARWLSETVTLARETSASGLVLALHANLRFERNRDDGWALMRELIIATAIAFDGPVLLLHGDTHFFRSDRPLLDSHGLKNLYRVECFGSPFTSSWVSIGWNPAAASAEAGPFNVSIRTVG